MKRRCDSQDVGCFVRMSHCRFLLPSLARAEDLGQLAETKRPRRKWSVSINKVSGGLASQTLRVRHLSCEKKNTRPPDSKKAWCLWTWRVVEDLSRGWNPRLQVIGPKKFNWHKPSPTQVKVLTDAACSLISIIYHLWRASNTENTFRGHVSSHATNLPLWMLGKQTGRFWWLPPLLRLRAHWRGSLRDPHQDLGCWSSGDVSVLTHAAVPACWTSLRCLAPHISHSVWGPSLCEATFTTWSRNHGKTWSESEHRTLGRLTTESF